MEKKTTRQKARESKDPRVEEMSDEFDAFNALDILSTSEGGKILIKSLTKDVMGTLETIVLKYNTLTHIEFIAYSAKIKEKIDILRSLTRARKNKQFITEEIDKLLEETLQD